MGVLPPWPWHVSHSCGWYIPHSHFYDYPQGAKKLFFWALAQLTDKIDPMYIIPKDRPGPHDDARLIYFLGVTKFGHQGAQKGGWVGRDDEFQ